MNLYLNSTCLVTCGIILYIDKKFSSMSQLTFNLLWVFVFFFAKAQKLIENKVD